jgi:hypothetical protein
MGNAVRSLATEQEPQEWLITARRTFRTPDLCEEIISGTHDSFERAVAVAQWLELTGWSTEISPLQIGSK